MEDYLLCMKTLRSQMNAKSETKQLKEDTEQMMKAKGQICSQILERQRKIVSLESDSSTLAQTLELIQQEKASLSSKLLEMRTYFTKVGEEINAKLQEQQDWVNSHKISRKLGEHVLVKDRIGEQTGETEGKSSIDGDLITDNLGSEAKNNLMAKLDAAKATLDEISQMKSKLVMENSKMKQLLEQVKFKANDFEVSCLLGTNGAALHFCSWSQKCLWNLPIQCQNIGSLSSGTSPIVCSYFLNVWMDIARAKNNGYKDFGRGTQRPFIGQSWSN
ncbi:uncharacterized protein LOC126700281 isoform X3 [Quercus robur]|uniref:uncharacterized protein LOC126700281 isoform X3 n=1 Tax=Quercus robur TaxID=38942 RepID=UPI002163FA6A|nr:uncharacterized protein LOC126700281 isoform X3 [Quercus robur]XP_050254315.1 uncharacterized protein LOC126700281 isoform X3 [Quercus robur]